MYGINLQLFNSKLKISIFTICLKSYILRKTCGFAQIAEKNCSKLKFGFKGNFRKKYYRFCANCAKSWTLGKIFRNSVRINFSFKYVQQRLLRFRFFRFFNQEQTLNSRFFLSGLNPKPRAIKSRHAIIYLTGLDLSKVKPAIFTSLANQSQGFTIWTNESQVSGGDTSQASLQADCMSPATQFTILE